LPSRPKNLWGLSPPDKFNPHGAFPIIVDNNKKTRLFALIFFGSGIYEIARLNALVAQARTRIVSGTRAFFGLKIFF